MPKNMKDLNHLKLEDLDFLGDRLDKSKLKQIMEMDEPDNDEVSRNIILEGLSALGSQSDRIQESILVTEFSDSQANEFFDMGQICFSGFKATDQLGFADLAKRFVALIERVYNKKFGAVKEHLSGWDDEWNKPENDLKMSEDERLREARLLATIVSVELQKLDEAFKKAYGFERVMIDDDGNEFIDESIPV